MILTIDFETRSVEDLPRAGPWRYAQHPTTRVMCLALKVDGGKPFLHFPEWVVQMHPEIKPFSMFVATMRDIREFVNAADEIHAHNAEFEMAIWSQCYPGWELPIEKVFCTAARAAMCGLPRNLEGACKAMKLPVEKDMEGNALMRKMCKPRKPTKVEKAELGENALLWVEDQNSFLRLGQYCAKDTDAEYALGEVLPRLPKSERSIWLMDQRINRRGLPIDVSAVQSCIRLDEEHRKTLLARFKEITGIDGTPSCLDQVLTWLSSRGCGMNGLTKEDVKRARNTVIPPDVDEVLRIRQSWGKTSVNKFSALEDRVQIDRRARACFLYHAATTGRWGGKAFQPHNLPSRDVITDPDLAIQMILEGAAPEDIQLLWGDPQGVLSGCVRGMIKAPPGQKFYCADFSAIEGRGLAWLAGEVDILEDYRQGKDLYKIAAGWIFHVDPKDVSKGQRQIGKVAELACGYQGGANAFNAMAETYGMTPLPEQEAKDIVSKWRQARPITVSFWYDLQRAAMNAIENPGRTVVCRRVSFVVMGNFLVCKLPSGRGLFWPFPSIGEKVPSWGGDPIPVIKFWGVNLNNQWAPLETYGGRLAENITQAVCRDALCVAMLRLEEENFPVHLHVHDETLSMVPERDTRFTRFMEILQTPIPWAPDFPIKAEGWEGIRYKK